MYTHKVLLFWEIRKRISGTDACSDLEHLYEPKLYAQESYTNK